MDLAASEKVQADSHPVDWCLVGSCLVAMCLATEMLKP
jgi:hypothetical protein